MSSRRTTISLTVSAILAVVFCVLNIFYGSVHIPYAEVVKALTGGDVPDAVRFIVVESRFPQALTAVLCGAALAAAGLMMQTIFANPLADPSILRVNAGARPGEGVAMHLQGATAAA